MIIDAPRCAPVSVCLCVCLCACVCVCVPVCVLVLDLNAKANLRPSPSAFAFSHQSLARSFSSLNHLPTALSFFDGERTKSITDEAAFFLDTEKKIITKRTSTKGADL